MTSPTPDALDGLIGGWRNNAAIGRGRVYATCADELELAAATLRAEREELVDALKDANEWLLRTDRGGTAHQRRIESVLRKQGLIP